MSTAKEIKTRISSVNSTKKITRAMEMIAASKLKKARERMEISRPYAQIARRVISHLALAHPEYQHPYLQTRKVKRVGYIIVSTDRGLCGPLNLHAFKTTITHMQQWQQQNIAIDCAIIGHKAEMFFKRAPVNIVAYTHHIGDAPQVHDLIGSVKVMLDRYDNGEIDALYLISNIFINTIQQKPKCEQLLPLEPEETKDSQNKPHWDYIYEPDAKSLLTLLLIRYIESQVYQGVVENLACEQASRMFAMKNASDNANDLIKTLKLDYNKARQAAITKEIAEIVSGGLAIED